MLLRPTLPRSGVSVSGASWLAGTCALRSPVSRARLMTGYIVGPGRRRRSVPGVRRRCGRRRNPFSRV
eukprot:5940102-Lingulodinium_polyedra.AAC.1